MSFKKLFDNVLDAVEVVAKPFKAAAPVLSGIAGLGTLYGAIGQNKAAKEAANAQMAFQQQMSDTSFQRQVRDLEAAGINPMLVSRLGGASTPMGAMPVIVNPYADAARAFSATQQSEASFTQAQTSKELSEWQIEQIHAVTEKIKEETKNIPIEGDRLKAVVLMLKQQENLLRAQGVTEVERTQMVKQTVQKLYNETDLLGFDIQAAKALDNLGREYKELGPLINTIVNVLRGAR